MPTVVIDIAAGGDDGGWDGVGGGYSATGTNRVFGDSTGSAYNKTVGFRFTGIAVPNGATITAATLRVTLTGGHTGTFPQSAVIRAEAADNPTFPTTRADGVARARTTAGTTWTFPSTPATSGTTTSPSIVSVVQEVVNRAGWASGNAMNLFINPESAAFVSAWQVALSTYEAASTSTAQLSITYSTGNTAPTADAGPDQTSVVPYTTVTLNGSGSSDSDGTISTYTWSQISGTTVTLSGSGATRTFTAPNVMGGATLVFGLTVTDNGGATSTQDTVTITTIASDIGIRSGGTWLARRIRKRVSGAWV